ncbi:MAG: SusC/RagA family TonB-linked outer membrane protein [Ginsengibacter sp.]
MKLLYLLLVAQLILPASLYCQLIQVQGKVVTASGMPVSGATITTTGDGSKKILETTTDGSFRLEAISGKTVLSVTHVGFDEASISVGSVPRLTIVLKEKAGSLDEVVIQAYGTTTRRLSTGNITKITSGEIETQPVSNPIAALEGRVPGVIISQASGVPGSSFNVEIRGRSSLDLQLSRNDPLFVIDGVFFEPGNQPANLLRSAANNNLGVGGLSPLNSINPADIESIEVLKDADATAIYGSRGANGVILITTKKGKAGITKITANVYIGNSKPTRTMPLLNTQQYVAMRREGFKNDGITPSSNRTDRGYAPDIMLWDTTRYTDFKKLLIGNTAHTTDAQLSLSGGTQLTQFLLSGGYHKETNVFSRSLADTRASVHFSINHSSENRRLSIALSGGYSNDKNQLIATDLTRFIYLPPNLRLHNEDGSLSFKEGGVSYYTVNNLINPLSVLLKRNTSVIENLYSNLLLSYHIFNSLTFKTSFSYNTFKNNEVSSIPSTAIDPYVSAFQTPSASFANSFTNSWIAEPQLNYIKNSLHGKLDILIGGTLQQKAYKGLEINASHYSNDLLLNNPGAASLVTALNSEALYHYAAIFGRVNYNLKDMYILNATFRRDGSSRFGPGNQFANFGAIGAGWIFSGGSFFKKQLPFISFGKLRMSYGITGNDQIGDYAFLNLWSADGNTYQGVQTVLPDKLYNPGLEWETNKKLEAAIELGFFKDKLLLSGSFYRNRSGNQLTYYPLPIQTGFQGIAANLPALVQNSGLELVITSKNITSPKFTWVTSLNLTVPRNKLISFPGLAATRYNGLYIEGQPLTVINRLKYLGVDATTGIYSFDDVNKDGNFNAADYQVAGYAGPRIYGGIINSLGYHNFQLEFLLEFKKQTGQNYLAQLFNNFPGFIGNSPDLVLNRWQKPGDIAAVQQYIATFTNIPAIIASNVRLSNSNGIYGDASFIRLKNISFAYSLRPGILKTLKISGFKAYIIAQNLFTITRYKGPDPETQNAYVLPPLKTIAGGIQITF